MHSSKVRRHRPHLARHHQSHSRSLGSWGFLVSATGLVVFLIFYTATLLHQDQQLHGGGGGGAHLSHSSRRSLPTLDELYGDKAGRWPSSASAGGAPSQLLLLSYYDSQASLAARLLMLMGVYAGEAAKLRIDPADKLRWWELQQLTNLNDLMLQQHSSPGLPYRLARGFHTSKLTKEEVDYYQDRMQGIIAYMGQHKPWLLKDPRMSWLAALWLERLEAPVCVLVVDMQPQRLAEHLSAQQLLSNSRQHQQLPGGASSGEIEVSAATHVERWTNATLSALKACFGVPTIVIPNTVLKPPLLQPFLDVLQQHMKAAGVQGTRLPATGLLQQQYVQYLQPGPAYSGHCHPTAGANGTSSNSAGGPPSLADTCSWLPPLPQAGHGGIQPGAVAAAAAAAGPDAASILPVPTQALLSALHEHLAVSLAHPATTALQYSRVAGEVYSAYASRVKQLVSQAGSGSHPQHTDYHGIGALIVEALKHVESTVAAATLAGQRLQP